MKLLVLFCLLSVVGLSIADTNFHPRGCQWIMGRCARDCEEGTHGYAIGCGHFTPEPTCDEPNPVESKYDMCDYSACYCDPPTVRDLATNQCVTLDKCPKKND